jgi:hypothetical protein
MKILCLYAYMSTKLCDMKGEESKDDQGKQEVRIADTNVSWLSRLSYAADFADGTLTLLFQKRDTDKNTATSN